MEWIKANETRIPELERKAFVNEIFMYCDNDKKMKGNLGKVWKEYKVANDRTRGGTISLVSDSSIINYGDITSNDASITIKCRVFKNFGRVQSKNNAAITIQCHSFDQENNSNIAPKPTIIMPWQYLMLDAKQQYIQLDVNRIPDTERDDFRTAALNATYKIKYFDAQHVEQFVDEICIDQGANEEKENLNIHNALDLIAIDQNHLYSFIEIMVSVLENKSNSDRTYASYKFERELLLDIYDMHQNTPLEIDYQLDVHKFNSETGSGGCIEIHSKSAIIIQKNGALNANECAPEKHGQSDVNCDGGAISLVSDSSIINYGDILSNGTNDVCSGGSINIKCGVFKNFGRVQSKNNGTITIQCHSFEQENDSDIVPKPTILC
eukprot:902608_1